MITSSVKLDLVRDKIVEVRYAVKIKLWQVPTDNTAWRTWGLLGT